ncbi:MAG TPA: GNAT family N-acetyltransferase [Blastocatellia bacterium]|nr:GNAT family N-acetyltransferase [Blastocatellia bacterium]
MQALKPTLSGHRRAFKGTLCPMTLGDLNECWLLDLRCFADGEAYERETFRYLLSNPQTISRQIRGEDGRMCAFAIGLVELDGTGHITTLGVAPEYRRRGLAHLMLLELERSFASRGVLSIKLEVRVDNVSARMLYEKIGYRVLQRMNKYYSNGDDGYLMVKSLM